VHSDNTNQTQRRELFVGRHLELLYLESAIERAKADGGRLALLRGEKGIGKTRLVSEFAARAAARKCCVLWGRWEEAKGTPLPRRFRVFAGDLRSGDLLLSQSVVTPDDLSGLGLRIREACEASGLLGCDAGPDLVRHSLEATFGEEPTVEDFRECLLIIDDLNTSDQLSLLLLSSLMQELRRTSSLIIGVYQDAEEDLDAIFSYLDEVDSLELCGLSKTEVGGLVGSLCGEAGDASIVDPVYDLSRGNPAVVKQVVAIAGLLKANAGQLITTPEILAAKHVALDPVPCDGGCATDIHDESSDKWLMREGDYWTIRLRGRKVRLRHLKGLTYIDYLLQHPGTPVHALELAGLEYGSERDDLPAGAISYTADGANLRDVPQDDAGPMLDWQATEAYGRRLKELTEELDEATEFNDLGRLTKLQAERTFIMGEMARSIGLRGRARNGISVAERARVSVTHAIKFVIHRIRKEQPELGRLLSAAIRTGLYCSFMAEMLAESPWEQSPLRAVPEPASTATMRRSL
jgi:hypothetical protein